MICYVDLSHTWNEYDLCTWQNMHWISSVCFEVNTEWSFFRTHITLQWRNLLHPWIFWSFPFIIWTRFVHYAILLVIRRPWSIAHRRAEISGQATQSNKFILITLWGWATHICVNKLTITGSDNGLSPGRCQAIIWTNAGILSIGPLKTMFCEIFDAFMHFHTRKCVWKCRLENGGHFVSAPMW